MATKVKQCPIISSNSLIMSPTMKCNVILFHFMRMMHFSFILCGYFCTWYFFPESISNFQSYKRESSLCCEMIPLGVVCKFPETNDCPAALILRNTLDRIVLREIVGQALDILWNLNRDLQTSFFWRGGVQ